MSKFDDFIADLDPKTASRVKTAQEVETIRLPTASYSLNNALGGGIGKGRITLLYGNQSSGKTLLMQESIGEWQKMGLVCAFVDVEGTWDKEWAARLGVNNSELLLVQSKSSARIEAELVPLMEKKIDVVVIDSISNIMPEAFVDEKGHLNDQNNRKQMGAQAKAITNLINGLMYVNEETAVVLLSQTTTEIGQMYAKQVPHGGRKALFAASQIIKLSSSNNEDKQIKGELTIGSATFETLIGRKVEGFVEKNKLGRQSTKFGYNMYYAGPSVGIDYASEVVEDAMAFDVLQGTKWIYWGEKKWQGKQNTINHFRENKQDLEELEKQLFEVRADV